MHELALMAELQQLAQEQARRAGAQRIHRLRLRVGVVAGVDPEALQQAFAVLVSAADASDLWQGAQLELQPVPERWACTGCGLRGARRLTGRELELVALEVS